jgi:SHO1 osmosensor
MLHIFNSLGTGGLTPPSRRRRTNRAQSVHGNNGYAANYASGVGSHDVPYDSKAGAVPIVPIGSGPNRSQHSFAAPPGSQDGGAAPRSVGAGTGPGSVGKPPSIGGGDVGPGSPLMGSGAAGVGAVGTRSGSSPPASRDDEPGSLPESLVYRAKALYACQLSCRFYQVVLSLNSISRYREFRRSE